MIVVAAPPRVALRGYRIHVEDLEALAAEAPKDSMRLSIDECFRRRKLQRFQVGAFEVSRIRGLRCRAYVNSREPGDYERITRMLSDRTPVLPWRAYECRLVSRTRKDHRDNLWRIGLVFLAAVLALIVGVILNLAFG